MPIPIEEFKKLIEEKQYETIEKINNINSDGRNLLVRIPKEIADYFGIRKGDKIKFLVKIEKDKPKKLEVEIIKNVKRRQKK